MSYLHNEKTTFMQLLGDKSCLSKWKITSSTEIH